MANGQELGYGLIPGRYTFLVDGALNNTATDGGGYVTAHGRRPPFAQRPSGPTHPFDGAISTTGSASDINAALTRAMFDYYRDTFFGQEEELFKLLGDNAYYARQVDRAGANARQGIAAAAGTQERQLSRYGIQVSPEMRAAMERKLALEQAGAIADARNQTRTALDDQIMAIRQNMIGFGRNLADMSASATGQAAQLNANRDATNRQISAQNTAAGVSAASTIAMIAAMMWSLPELKENVAQADRAALEEAVLGLRLYEFDYVPEMGDPNRYVGTMVDETPELLRSADGQQVNLVNALFGAIAVVQRQHRELAELRSELAALKQKLEG